MSTTVLHSATVTHYCDTSMTHPQAKHCHQRSQIKHCHQRRAAPSLTDEAAISHQSAADAEDECMRNSCVVKIEDFMASDMSTHANEDRPGVIAARSQWMPSQMQDSDSDSDDEIGESRTHQRDTDSSEDEVLISQYRRRWPPSKVQMRAHPLSAGKAGMRWYEVNKDAPTPAALPQWRADWSSDSDDDVPLAQCVAGASGHAQDTAKVATLMGRLKVSQNKLALRGGVNHSNLSDWLHGSKHR